MPNFPYTEVKALTRWTNYTGTLAECEVPIYCTPDVMGDAGDQSPRRLARHGAAIAAIVDHCLSDPELTLRTVGARFSLSSIIKPGRLILDPGNMNVMLRVKPEWLTDDYRRERGSRGFVPVFAQGGTHVSSINRRLAQAGLALQTSGAGDGHRIAGCIATGTHGSAIGIGAVHDTVRALHLVLDGERAVLVQSQASPACGPEVSAWLSRETGISTRHVLDDELFAAAQVGLGSLGFVHGVVLETVPLYTLEGVCQARAFADADLWKTITDLDTRRLLPNIVEPPYHFEVVFHPYPTTTTRAAYVTMYWKQPAHGVVAESPMPARPDTSSCMMGFISQLSEFIDGSASTLALRMVLGHQLEQRFRPGLLKPRLPGMIFGPTTLPPGHGTSTEVVVNRSDAHRTLEILFEVLREQADRGEHLLGVVAVRFLPKTSSLLGMNIHDGNCYIELPSIRNEEVLNIYRLWWDRLEQERVVFTCHFGQVHGMTPQRTARYFGDRAERWVSARRRLLTSDAARRVFASALLTEMGLE